eukprot:13048916-Alexandrium_andersonii.AAC.1
MQSRHLRSCPKRFPLRSVCGSATYDSSASARSGLRGIGWDCLRTALVQQFMARAMSKLRFFGVGWSAVVGWNPMWPLPRQTAATTEH